MVDAQVNVLHGTAGGSAVQGVTGHQEGPVETDRS